MRCLSLWQPWASLWVAGVKIHETRHWPTNVRGRIFVHAAKHQDMDTQELCRYWPFLTNIEKLCGGGYDMLPYGAIVGWVDIVDCLKTEDVYQFSEGDAWGDRAKELNIPEDYYFGNYVAGRFAFKVENPVMLPKPVPWKGMQGFFEVDMTRFEVERMKL